MGIRLSLAAPLRGNKRWRFLERAETIHVATQFGDDPIYLAALWFTVHEETIYLPLDQASKHMANIERGGRLTAVVDEGHGLADVRGVHMEGHARRVEDREFAEVLEESVLQKYFYEGHPYLEEYVNFGQYNDRTFYEVVPDRMWGFDLREIANMATSEKRVLPDHVVSGNGKS
jgi:hypothetical protein